MISSSQFKLISFVNQIKPAIEYNIIYNVYSRVTVSYQFAWQRRHCR